jgi:SAM-dependent methyltransferase
MNPIEKITITQFHAYRTNEFGTGTVESLGWPDAESQQKRFEILSGIADLNNCSVIDAGCGHGDLFSFLQKKYPAAWYTGIDHIPALLDIALERYQDAPQVKFLLGDFTSAVLPPADYILCSGGLSYHNPDADFIQHSVEKLFNACRKGFGFNLLSTVKNTEGILVAYDAEKVLAVCRRLTNNVQLLENYLPGDFTIFMYH